MTVAPVFIVGSPRSGTSILVRALRGAGYHGFNEGNFLSVLKSLDRAVEQHFTLFGTADPETLIARIGPEVLKRRLFEVVIGAFAEHCPPSPWFDKTGNPEMIEVIPLLRTFWPDARFIFARRRAIENLVSRLRKFPQHSFEYHCQNWMFNMEAWRRLCQAHADLPGIEVDQFDIAETPAETASLIGRFLGLGAAQQAAMAAILQNERPQETEAGSASRTLSLAVTGWTEEQLEAFHRYCDNEMRAFGYTQDADYRTEAAACRAGTGLRSFGERAIRGIVGVCLATEIRGWAFDPTRPDEHLTVEVWVDGRSLGTTAAGQFRPDLAQAGIGKGDHGFIFQSPEPLPLDRPGAVKVHAFSDPAAPVRLPRRQPQP